MIKEFLKPSSAEEALSLKNSHKNAFYLGGGTKLNNGGENYGAEVFISLEKLNLKGIKKEEGKIFIGALETLQSLIESGDIPGFLKESALGESNRNIRNASTVGGTIGAAGSRSTLLVGLMAMEAEIETAEHGFLPLCDYVEKRKDSLILNIIIPAVTEDMYRNDHRKTANSKPEVSAAVSLNKSGQDISGAVIVVGGLHDRPVRLRSVEGKLSGGLLTNADTVQDAVMDEIVKYTEKKENGVYLNYICGVMVADCVGRSMRSR